MKSKTFTEAANKYVSKYAFLEDECGPLVLALSKVAEKLDEGIAVNMVAEYTKIVRMLETTRKAHTSYTKTEEAEEDDLLNP